MKEKGKVIWFNSSKGFGFIHRQSAPDIFVHFSGIVAEGYRTLNENDLVEFEIETGPKQKPQAINVTVINARAVAG